MARQLRLEFESAVYHVINRSNYRSALFRDDGAKLAFLACLEGRLLTQSRTGDCADHSVRTTLVTARKNSGHVGESGPHSPLCGRGVS